MLYLLFQATNWITIGLSLLVLVLEAWALIDAVSHRAEAYPAAGKLTKQAWLIILALALAARLLIPSPFMMLNLIGTVAAIVYLVDARPALRALTRR